MSKIIWLDQEQVREHLIPNRGFLSVGRSSDNAIVLSDPKVSRHHAKLVCGPHGCLLKDLKTGRGLEVNGDQVHSRFLRNGDVIRIGQHVLEYQTEDSLLERAAAGNAVPSYRFEPGGKPVEPEVLENAPKERAFLRYIDGPQKGKVQSVDRPLLTVGDPKNYYAAVSQRTNGYYLLNLGKGVYVKLNDAPVHGAGAIMSNGDVITMGAQQIEFKTFSSAEH